MRGIELRNAATKRIFGFEILPAPFVVAHMQMATMLGEQGVSLGPQQRASIFLTNSLTGWNDEEQLTLPEFPALKNEAKAASDVKREAKIIVILGNPPYRGPAGVAEDEEQELLSPYYVGLSERFNIQARGINDLYVRFIRLAERQIAETVELGIISFISNNSWLKGLSHPIMRERMLNTFGKIWVDNLHGNRIISERTPNGNSCETIFSVRGQSTGIKVGTAITTLVKKGPEAQGQSQVFYRDIWGMPDDPATWGRAEKKRAALVWSSSLTTDQLAELYQAINPSEESYFALVPRGTEAAYLLWPALDKIFIHHYPGVKTSRDTDLVSIEPQLLRERMQNYFDQNLDDQEVARYAPVLMQDASRYNAKATRRELLRTSRYREDHLVSVAYRPFDTRWLYWEGTTKLLDEKRAELFEQIFPNNLYLEAVRHQRRSDHYDHGVVVSHFMDLNFVDGGARCFPLYERQTGSMFEEKRLNFRSELLTLLLENYGEYLQLGEDLFYHIVAILNSPKYRNENVGDIEQDWPRIPIPKTSDHLRSSSLLGQQITNLLRPETNFRVSDELRSLATPTRIDGLQLTEADFAVTFRYGGIGKYELSESNNDNKIGRLWLNSTTFWDDVPQSIWTFTIGGYPVVKKWLDYRHFNKLRRPLYSSEVRFLTQIVQRIATLLTLGPSLDENYMAIKSNAFEIPSIT